MLIRLDLIRRSGECEVTLAVVSESVCSASILRQGLDQVCMASAKRNRRIVESPPGDSDW